MDATGLGIGQQVVQGPGATLARLQVGDGTVGIVVDADDQGVAALTDVVHGTNRLDTNGLARITIRLWRGRRRRVLAESETDSGWPRYASA